MPWLGNKAPQQDTDSTIALAQWVEDEFERFANEQVDNLQALELRPIFNVPIRAREGMIIYADSSKFNPGFGTGPYYRSAAGVWIPMMGFTETLLTTREWYVDTTNGSDANDGLAAGTGRAFKTVNKAIAKTYGLNNAGFAVNINVADGTYAESILINGPWIGTGAVTLKGNTTTPLNCIISPAAGNALTVINGVLSIQGFSLASPAQFCLAVSRASQVNFTGKMDFGAGSFGTMLIAGGSVVGNNVAGAGAINISGGGGGGAIFILCTSGGSFQHNVAAATVTLSANVTFAVTAYSTLSGYINSQALTWNIGAFTLTGQRFNVNNFGAINTGGGGINYFPGTVAGVGTLPNVAPWGLYI